MSEQGQRRLVLLRHAKAEPWAASDEARPLALRGRRQASAVGEAIALRGPVPELALVSAATRTRQTWELLAARLAHEVPSLVLPELYHAAPRQVLTLVQEHGGEHAGVIVVGHEPVMSALAAMLADGDSDSALVDQVRHGIPTATRCVLEFDAPWSELARGGARLVAVTGAPELIA